MSKDIPTQKDKKQTARAEALRENLLRRKAQQKQKKKDE